MSYLVEAYAPAGTDVSGTAERARRAAEDLSREGTPVRYLHPVFVPGDETCFHLFEAESVEAVHDASERAGIQAHRFVEAVSDMQERRDDRCEQPPSTHPSTKEER